MNLTTRMMVCAVCAGLWSGTASAQSTDNDADAERLFREGQQLLEQRRFGEACPKFEAAYAKDHQLGTLLNLAYCHKEAGATWLAWLEFKEAEVRAVDLKRNDRRDFARLRMAELEKSLARAVVDRSPKVELSEVLVEERRVPEAEKGVTFAVEPGQRRKFIFRAKGKKEVVQLITIAKGDRVQHIPAPQAMEDEEAPPVVAAPVPEPPPVAAPPIAAPVASGSGNGTLALALAGVGIVGVGIGAVTGIMSITNGCVGSVEKKDPKSCPAAVVPQGNPQHLPTITPAARAETNRGDTTSAISTFAFIGGGVALAGALVVYLVGSSSKSHASSDARGAGPSVTPELGAGYAGLRGAF